MPIDHRLDTHLYSIEKDDEEEEGSGGGGSKH